MKGLTQKLRDLGLGETVEITNGRRDNIYMIARRVGIRVNCEKFIGGFMVTKVSDVNDWQPAVTEIADKGGMNDAMANFLAKAQAKSGKPMIEKPSEGLSEHVATASPWIVNAVQYDPVSGDDIWTETHYKTRETRVIKRATHFE